MGRKQNQIGMKVLLLDRQTRLFYGGHDTWTNDPAKAFDYQFSADLADYREKLALVHTELVVHFGGPSFTAGGLKKEPMQWV